jgi:hypothetical protein
MRERGALMYKHTQQIMNQMQDNPDLIRLPRLPTDSPEESLARPSGPNFMNLDNINESDDPESIMPLAGSPVGVMTQPETGWVSVETNVPNPLREFINIYSDDEIPEESCRTPVRVQEEKGPDKTSSPSPEVQTQEIPQKEKEVESGLDTRRPKMPETRADNSKDKSEPNELREGSMLKEINDSIADKQLISSLFPMPLFHLILRSPTSDRRRLGLQSTTKKFKNLTLNIYTPLKFGKHTHMG